MAVSFEDALNTLKSMFPDIEDETLSMVLESQNGHMEKTVEILLSMCDTGAPPLDGFVNEGADSEAVVPQQDQIDSDEALARALQDAQFVEQLRTNSDAGQFSSLFGSRGPESRPRAEEGDFCGPPQTDSLSYEAISKGLSSMGEAAKTKLTLLSRQFKMFQGEDPAPAPSRSSGAGMYTALPNDDDEESTSVVTGNLQNDDTSLMRRAPASDAQDEAKLTRRQAGSKKDD